MSCSSRGRVMYLCTDETCNNQKGDYLKSSIVVLVTYTQYHICTVKNMLD